MASESGLLAVPASADHLLQLYSDEGSLIESAGTYLGEGLRRGETVIAVAAPSQLELFQTRLREEGIDLRKAIQDSALILLDAQECLARFMVDGHPQWDRFLDVVGTLIEDTRMQRRASRLRVYGEMVNLLWREGNLSAMIRLEEYWHRLIRRYDFSLFCAYRVDLLDPGLDPRSLEAMLATHNRIVESGAGRRLKQAVDLALDETIGSERAAALRPLMKLTHLPRRILGEAETTLLWLRNNLPAQSPDILARARAFYASPPTVRTVNGEGLSP